VAATYRDAPLLKPPVWTWEIPIYFFVGGAAGAAAIIGAAAQWSGGSHPALVRDARWIAAAGALLSPLLLISDLGRPARFLNMLRVFKLRSPMSVGAWTLAVFSGAAVAAVLPLGTLSEAAALGSALTGAILATYTGVLLGATVIPAWSRHVDVLPVVFGASGLAAAVGILELLGHRTAAMNLLGITAAAVETVLMLILWRRGHAGTRLMRAAEILSGPAPLVLRLAASHIPAIRIGTAVITLAGSLLTRVAWIESGRRSVARDMS
jgi:formate-dependent nitrite reductase membrane component NrfD